MISSDWKSQRSQNSLKYRVKIESLKSVLELWLVILGFGKDHNILLS